jgi:hypothetical protein
VFALAACASLAAVRPLAVAKSRAPSALAACHGQRRPLVVSSQMPYAEVGVRGASGPEARGQFVLDFASTRSTIDLTAFPRKVRPAPEAGTTGRFAALAFFGDWLDVVLDPQDHRGVRGRVRQAGILGSDFLAQHVYTLDYGVAGKGAGLWRSGPGATCSDDVLRAEGLLPLDTAGYYSDDLAKLRPGVPRVPTVPVRVGGVSARAQLDTGFDDRRARHSVNVNRAFAAALAAAGVSLVAQPKKDVWLSTCVPGVSEVVRAHRLPPGVAFELVGTDGVAVRAVADAILFVKETPPAAASCGGIGTWPEPAAQVGASFYVDARRLVFDPYSSRVWMTADRPR